MRIAVVGAGAMGSIFGARLTEAGHDTVLVDVARPLVEKLRRDGVTLVQDGQERVVEVEATTDPASFGAADAVVFFVKCYHTESAAKGAAPLVGAHTAVASLQNGWGNEEVLARHFGAERVIAGVTYDSGTVLELGRVAHTGRGKTLIGPYEGEALGPTADLEHVLVDAGFEVEATPSIRTEIWKKLIVNAATLPTAALTGLTAGALGQPGELLELVDEVAREASAVAIVAGYGIDPEERVEVINNLLANAGAGKASMLQDLEAGRRTELDVITGAVLAEAEAQGVEVPLNTSLFALVRGYERAHGLV